jgi:hypothetical protein
VSNAPWPTEGAGGASEETIPAAAGGAMRSG